MKKNKKTLFRILFFILVIFLVYLSLRDSWSAIFAQLLQTTWKVTVAAILCGLAFNLFDGTAIWILARRKTSDFSWRTGVSSSFYSTFFRVATFGSGSAVAGMYYMSRYKVPVTSSLGFYTLNYTIQRTLIVICFLVTYGVQFETMSPQYHQYGHYMILGVIMAVLVVASLIAFCISGKLHWLLFKIADFFLKKPEQKEKVEDFKLKATIVRQESMSLLRDYKSLLLVVLCNMGKIASWYVIPAILLDPSPDQFLLYISIAAMMTALANVIPAPGGMGSTEFVFMLLFAPFCGKIKAASAMVLYRFFTYYFPAVPGAFVLLKRMRTDRQADNK